LVLGLLGAASSLLTGRGSLIFNSRDSVSRLLEWVSPLVALDRAVPSLFRIDPIGPLALSAVWVAALGIGAGLLHWGCRRRWATAPGAGAALTLAVVAIVVGVGLEAGWRIQGADPLDGSVSRVNVIEAASRHPSAIGLSYRPLAVVHPPALASRVRLSPSTRRPTRANSPAFALAPVPAGEYELDASSLGSATTILSITIGRGERPVAVWPINPLTRTTTRILRLPCSVNAVVIDASETDREAVARLGLRPVRTWTGRGCPDSRAHRGLRYGAATVHFFDSSAYPEAPGFWVRGRAESTVAVVPDSPAALASLNLRGGAVPVRVRLVSGAWTVEISLEAGQQRDIAVPVDRTTGAALIRIKPDDGFVPAEVDAASRDRRFLGCWVSVPE
jgi:hypothetical protein